MAREADEPREWMTVSAVDTSVNDTSGTIGSIGLNAPGKTFADIHRPPYIARNPPARLADGHWRPVQGGPGGIVGSRRTIDYAPATSQILVE